jgi:hypothetical protein
VGLPTMRRLRVNHPMRSQIFPFFCKSHVRPGRRRHLLQDSVSALSDVIAFGWSKSPLKVTLPKRPDRKRITPPLRGLSNPRSEAEYHAIRWRPSVDWKPIAIADFRTGIQPGKRGPYRA